ncbi:MAG TPA: class I SAM-dependent methyltransferase [Anaerolineae bacterium]|nr:class I SAM-dependent methyltransferase [Anaerolineae bacterium]
MSNEHPPICDYEGSDYQQTFWDAGEREYEHRVEQVALARLLPAHGERLLEVGAGAGRNTARYQGFRQIILLDFSRTQLRQARARLGSDSRYLYVAADVYSMPFAPALFDAATMVRTLHHMAEPQEALEQIRTTLHTNARFVLEYANKRNLKAIVRWLLRRQSWNPFSRDPVEFARLNYDFHPKAVGDWLQQSGFSIDRMLTVSHFRLNLLKRMIPTGILVALDSLLQHTGNWWQYTPSVFVRTTAVGRDASRPEFAFWRCPLCASLEMIPQEDGVLCSDCDRLWPLVDGIYDFKIPADSD